MKRLALVVAVSFLTGCPDTGVVCRTGTAARASGTAEPNRIGSTASTVAAIRRTVAS